MSAGDFIRAIPIRSYGRRDFLDQWAIRSDLARKADELAPEHNIVKLVHIERGVKPFDVLQLVDDTGIVRYERELKPID